MRVQDILRSNGSKLVTIPYDATIHQASRKMSAEHVGMLLVLDERDQLVGLLSERDVTCFIARKAGDALRSPVSEAMSDAWLMAFPDDSVTHVMRLMTEERVRHIPVIEQGALAGVISIGDILKSRLAEKDQEAEVLRDIARVARVAAA